TSTGPTGILVPMIPRSRVEVGTVGTLSLLAVAGALMVAGCGAPGQASMRTDAPQPTASADPATAGRNAAVDTPATPGSAIPGAGSAKWRPVGTRVAGQPAVFLATAAHGSVTLMRMDSRLLSFRLIPGWSYPEGSPRTAADRNPNSWVPTIVAAFNGAFKLADGTGGYFYADKLVRPLQNGLASAVITKDGRLTVGKWGRDQQLTADVLMVRQNMRLLVDQGTTSAAPNDDPQKWGRSSHIKYVNRSALGQLPNGDLVFAYGHDVDAYGMAKTLIGAQVVNAIMLDMNVMWPAGFYFLHSGSHTKAIPINAAMLRDPGAYLKPFEKDFFVASPTVQPSGLPSDPARP
ncbi:MAG: hypothetical protein WCI74_08340, partial [Actinomycetes bacterium]